MTGGRQAMPGGRPAAAAEPPSLIDVYHRLLEHFGPRHWWPARTPFEVAVGAILTQAVAWRNVEVAITNLDEAGLLEPAALASDDPEVLAGLIRPAGYYRVKARKLQALSRHLMERYGGRIEAMADRPLSELRPELLGIYGIGPETADSILVYAVGHPSFVVDAYTCRIFGRLGLWPDPFRRPDYPRVQAFFHRHLPADTPLFNEFHALIDRLGHTTCLKTNPACGSCPLDDLCRHEGLRPGSGLVATAARPKVAAPPPGVSTPPRKNKTPATPGSRGSLRGSLRGSAGGRRGPV